MEEKIKIDPVGRWLRDMGLDSYVPLFKTHRFDMDSVQLLDEAALDDLGITAAAPRLKIMTSIKGPGYRQQAGAPSPPPPTPKSTFPQLQPPGRSRGKSTHNLTRQRPVHKCTPVYDENAREKHQAAERRYLSFKPVRSTFSNQVVFRGHPIDLKYEGDGLHDKPFTKVLARLGFYFWSFIFHVRTTFHMFNLLDFMVLCISWVGTWLCYKYELSANANPTLFLSGVIFPLAFAVQSAYQRREKALEDLSQLKGATLSLFLLYRDWKDFTTFEEFESGKQFLFTTGDVILKMFNAVRKYLIEKHEGRKQVELRDVYETFGDISWLTETLRTSSTIPPPLFTRLIQDLQLMITSFEKLRIAADYRTPMAIRCYLKLFIVIMPIALTPYNAYLAQNSKIVSVIASTIVPLSFLCLQNVQIQLENLFGSYHDDISLDYLENMEVINSMVSPFAEKELLKQMEEELLAKQNAAADDGSYPALRAKTFIPLSLDSETGKDQI
eukprot:TRINITY_DN47668_c0_g1_i1.p1 TRINITY_DN47668_c0_g1~~TRINITY_DN47668_c0_g1_i1.p1  ORF type:complete len:507 (-),score=17.05 TRINITY_DN47668_c0_g1_i1:115-1605(-)